MREKVLPEEAEFNGRSFRGGGSYQWQEWAKLRAKGDARNDGRSRKGCRERSSGSSP